MDQQLLDNSTLRLLQNNEQDLRQYLDLLSQLTKVDPFELEKMQYVFQQQSLTGKIYVLEFQQNFIGTFKLNFEWKFSRGGQRVSHLEEVIVDKNFRGKKIGQFLVQKAIECSQQEKCYWMIGDCREGLLEYYQKTGLEKQGCQIGKYLTF